MRTRKKIGILYPGRIPSNRIVCSISDQKKVGKKGGRDPNESIDFVVVLFGFFSRIVSSGH